MSISCECFRMFLNYNKFEMHWKFVKMDDSHLYVTFSTIIQFNVFLFFFAGT